MSDPLFTHIWAFSMAFVLMQVKTGFYTPRFNYILPFFFKSGMMSTIYHKYSKHFIEVIPLPASDAIRIYWNNFFNLGSEFFSWLFLFFRFCNENLCIYFWKILIAYQKLSLSSKRIKISKCSNLAEFIVFLWNFANAFSLELPTKRC